MVVHAVPDFLRLSDDLGAMAYPSRLQILYHLRVPRAAGEIRVSAEAAPDGRARLLARQTVQSHLQKLVDRGLAMSEATEGGAQRYRINAQRMFAVADDVLRVASLHAGAPASLQETEQLDPERPVEGHQGPRLVLVHGLYEGRVYPFAVEDEGPWMVGRDAGSPVVLDYDPYVSGRNAAIVRDGDRFFVEDQASRNGTWVNWTQLPSGGSRELHSGDIIGVGRSRLVFVAG